MKTLLAFLCLGIVMVAAPVFAVDQDADGVDDSHISFAFTSGLEVGEIAVVNTANGSQGDYVNRITALGYSISIIPANSTLETLLNYAVVILPVGHGSATNYATIDALSDDYHMYVNSGGGLWIAQPNPYQMPDGTADINWAPYELTLQFEYNGDDCPVNVDDPSHCITEGMADEAFSFPGDNAISYGAEWQVLATGSVTGRPGVMFAEYGGGKVLVEMGHPAPGSLCAAGDPAFTRYLECLVGGIVATSETNWGSMKANYR